MKKIDFLAFFFLFFSYSLTNVLAIFAFIIFQSVVAP